MTHFFPPSKIPFRNLRGQSKKLFIASIILILALLVLLLFLAFNSSPKTTSSPSKYSAVYLKTGDIYFGELVWFPRLKLKNPWFLQRTADANNQPQVNIVPLAEVFWKPVNEIYLNRDEIILWTRLRSDSQVIQLLSSQ